MILGRVLGLSSLAISVGQKRQIHVSSRQVEIRGERAKWVDLGIPESLTDPAGEVFDKAFTNVLLEFAGTDIVIKVNDLLVKTGRGGQVSKARYIRISGPCTYAIMALGCQAF